MLRLFAMSCRSAFPPDRAAQVVTRWIKGFPMKNTRFGVCLPCLLAVVVSLAVAQTAGADTTLRWKFKAGQKLVYVMTQKTAAIADLGGKKLDNSVTQTIDMTWAVKGVDKDGTAEVEQTIDRIRFEMVAPGATMKVDTADVQDPPGVPEMVTKLLRAMAGTSFTVKITPRGEFRDVKIPPKLVEAFKDAGPVAAMLGNEEGLKKLSEQSMLIFPEAALAQGKSWKGERKMPSPLGTMAMDMTYTLESATGPVVKIGLDMKIDFQMGKDSPVEVKLTAQETKGHYLFDNAAGIMKSSEMVQKMTMMMSAGGQQTTQDMESTVKLELTKGGASK